LENLANQAEIQMNFKLMIVLCGMSVIMAIAIGSLIAQWIIQPISSINKAAEQMSNIYFVAPTSHTPIKELDKLNSVFAEMSQQFQASFESLVDQKLYLANLLETLPIGVAIHGADGSVTYLNESAKSLLGSESIPKADLNQLTSAYQIYLAATNQLYPIAKLPSTQALQGRCCYSDDLEVLRDGIRISLESKATPMFNIDGEVNGAIAIFKDISARKATEKLLSDYNQQLESDVQQRTLDLQQEILERQQMEVVLRKIEIELTIANQELEKQINIDGLTQIANRRCFDARLDQEWWRHCRDLQPIALILFDVDYFKRYNDRYGHQLGDDCLTKIAAAVDLVMRRPADLVARYGGEEFVVILPNTNADGAMVIADRIHAAIASLNIAHQNSDVTKSITVSIGVASMLASPERSPYILINQADQALYYAKKQGRNQSVLFAE
jgi:diguanylate cyclase (GGDEF)-like protein/PAS domain S-box-containing protein